jgi:hypothetical protein
MRKVLIIVLMSLVVLSNTACAAGKKGSAAEGKVVDGAGKAVSGVKVIAIQQQPLKGYERIETKTKADGTFVLKGLYPMAEYNLAFEGGQCNNAKTHLSSGPAGETTMLRGNVVLKFSPFKKGSDGVVADPRTGLQWAPSNKQPMNHYQAEEYVKNLSLAGGGWRLPTTAELKELYNTGETGCGCAEINEPSAYVWASESCVKEYRRTPHARDFYFITGTADCGDRDNNIRVLAVRSPK